MNRITGVRDIFGIPVWKTFFSEKRRVIDTIEKEEKTDSIIPIVFLKIIL